MVKSLYKQLKQNMFSGSLNRNTDLFEKAKIELMFNLLIIFSSLYIFGFLYNVFNADWELLILRLAGFVLLLLLFKTLRRTQHYTVPAIIWTTASALIGLEGLFMSEGYLTYSLLGFALLNVSLVTLLLKQTLKAIFYVFYVGYITVGLAMRHQLLPDWAPDFKLHNLTYEGNIVFELIPFFLLIYVLYGFISTEYWVKKRLANQIDFVVQQEKDIHTANLSMHKSIELAGKIQRSFLPDLSKLNKSFNDCFVFLKPVTDLTGDFYWHAEDDKNLFLAIVDSSENTITGAIVSSIYFDALDTAVKKEKIRCTDEIIRFVNKYVRGIADINFMKESIDIAILRVDKRENKAYFASEKNSLYIAKHNKKIVDEYKSRFLADKEGGVDIREWVIQLEFNDILYLCSDGMSKQFRGFDNLKFKQSVLKSYLNTIKHYPLAEQQLSLSAKLKEWKSGDVQSDDICIIGLKI